jgi:hypothetical protein
MSEPVLLVIRHVEMTVVKIQMGWISLLGIKSTAFDGWQCHKLPMGMISVRLFADTRVDGDPSALEFSIVVITDTHEQVSLGMFHLHQILLFGIQLWKVLHWRRGHNPLLTAMDFSPHQGVFISILPKDSSNPGAAISGIANL